MNKYIIRTYTNWLGMDLEYGAYAEFESDLEGLAEELAYENFESYDCVSYILDELYPGEESFEDYMYDEAYAAAGEYLGYSIELAEEDDLEYFDSLELVYDGRIS